MSKINKDAIKESIPNAIPEHTKNLKINTRIVITSVLAIVIPLIIISLALTFYITNITNTTNTLDVYSSSNNFSLINQLQWNQFTNRFSQNIADGKSEEQIAQGIKESAADIEEMGAFVYVEKNGRAIYETDGKSDIKEFECQYNPKTDDPIDEQNEIEDFEYEPSSFEQNLEDALQEMAEKLFQNRENQKNISKFFREYLSEFSKNQQIIVFYYYFLGFGISEIAEILNVKPQTIDGYIKRIDKKLAKFGKKCDL